jgi:hypothetical protein
MIKIVAITIIVPVLIIISALSMSYNAKKQNAGKDTTSSLKVLEKEGVVQ